MKVIILAGGRGARLWPLSRQNFPKQLLQFNSDKSLLLRTIERFLIKVSKNDIYIVTNKQISENIQAEASSLLAKKQILIEPEQRGTLGALCYFLKDVPIQDNEPIFVTPADHLMSGEKQFVENIFAKKSYSDKHILLFGALPKSIQTGFGYISLAKHLQNGMYEVDAFVEKPTYAKAKQIVHTTHCVWNTGTMLCSYKMLVSELKKYSFSHIEYLNGQRSFENLPLASIDVSLLQKSKSLRCTKIESKWTDVGCWDSVYEYLQPDEKQNVIIGNVHTINTKNSLIIGGKRVISTIDLDDLFIIDSDDALLIGKKGKSQKVKQLVSALESKKKRFCN